SKSCRKVVVVSPFYYILCRPVSSDAIYCGILVQRLHRGDFLRRSSKTTHIPEQLPTLLFTTK
ncbi:hypothetical protein, partial [Pseudoruminococcus massiliensis]|uniref:hypothetical protein n=1 Tax=Pseudoruminococcus massiliensis TaxID=2086583 RepID=UPI003AB84115